MRRYKIAFFSLIAVAGIASLPALGAGSAVDPRPVSGVPLGTRGDLPVPVNIDFRSNAVLPTLGPDALAYNATTHHVYAGNQRLFSIYNVVSPAHPSLIGRLELEPTALNPVIGSIVYPGSGNYVFVSVVGEGIYSIDVSDPSHPVVDGKYTDDWGALSLDGTLLYVAAGLRSVRILDVSDPSNLELLGVFTSSYGLLSDIWAGNGFAYVTAKNGLFDPYSVWIIDATNPAAPVRVNELLFSESTITGVSGEGSRLYVTAADTGMMLFDRTNPASPTFLGGGYGAPGAGSDVVTNGVTAYVSTTTGLAVINVANPASPTLLGSTNDLPSYGVPSGLALGPSGYVLLSAYSAGMQLVDVNPPSTPQIVASVVSPSHLQDVAVSGQYAFWVSSENGLFITDHTNVDRPRVVGVYASEGSANTVHVAGSQAFYAESGHLKILDVSDPANPTLLGSYLATVEGLDVVGNLAYLAIGSQGLRILDISNPATPVVIGNAPVSSSARDVKIVNGIAYVANWNDGLAIFDVSNPSSPTQIADFDTPNVAVTADVVGGYAYVADDSSNLLLILDVSDPTDPLFVGQYVAPGPVVDVVVVGDLAYVAARHRGLRVVDVSTPWAPAEVGSYETGDTLNAVAFQSGYAFTAEFSGGGTILHYANQCFDDYEPNNQFADAYPIVDADKYAPKICEMGDLDYFSITPPGNGTLQIVMQPPTGKNYNLFLYDAAQTLIAASVNAGDASEVINRVATDPGPYYLKVAGSAGQFDSTLYYTLFYLFQACPAPAQAVYIYSADVDVNFNTVLYVQDPNQPGTVTGYNLYRASHPAGPFALIGENLSDFDSGTPNVQLVDVDSDSCGPLCFYKVTALNGDCGGEGPQ